MNRCEENIAFPTQASFSYDWETGRGALKTQLSTDPEPPNRWGGNLEKGVQGLPSSSGLGCSELAVLLPQDDCQNRKREHSPGLFVPGLVQPERGQVGMKVAGRRCPVPFRVLVLCCPALHCLCMTFPVSSPHRPRSE